jgi:hypothetical protein
MPRELLLPEEMIDAAEQAHLLAVGQTPESLASDRQRRDALLWSITVLGEAAAQLNDDLKPDHADIPWQQPSRAMEPDRARLLVDRSGHSDHHGAELPAMVEQLRNAYEALDQP